MISEMRQESIGYGKTSVTLESKPPWFFHISMKRSKFIIGKCTYNKTLFLH